MEMLTEELCGSCQQPQPGPHLAVCPVPVAVPAATEEQRETAHNLGQAT